MNIRTCLAVLPTFCKSFLKLLPLAPHPQHLNISTSSKCWESSKISLVTRNFIGFPKSSSMFPSGCYPVWSCLLSSQQVTSSRTDTQCLHSDRKGEVWDRDARFGHFLDQPDKIKTIKKKIQNHAKDLSSKKQNWWIQYKMQKMTKKIRKDGTSFLSSQVFLDTVHRTRNWSQRVKRLARTAPSRMVLNPWKSSYFDFKKLSVKTCIRCQEISGKHQMVDGICLDTFGYHRFKQL